MKRKLPRRSFFTRILISYLCFVLISLMSSMMIYRLASARLIEKTTASDYAAFRQFYSMVDQELNNAADKVSELAGDYSGFLSLLEQASSKKHSGYTVYQIIHRLRLVTSNNLGDLFVYLPGTEKVMSGCYATLTASEYFRVYYDGQADCASLFQTDEQYTRLYTLYPLTQSSGRETLALKTFVFAPNTYPVICVLNPSSLQEQISYLEQNTGGNILVTDFDGSVLLRSSQLSDVDVTGLSLQDGSQQIKLDGRTYIAFRQTSTVAACRYISLIPIEAMEQSLSYFSLYTAVNIVVICLFGVLLAFLLSRYNYRPVSQLVKSAALLGGSKEPQEDSEFRYIEAIMENAITEKKQYLSTLSQFQQAQRFNCILNLINGSVPPTATAESVFADMGESLISHRFAVVFFRIEEWNDEVFSQNFADERPMLAKIILPNVVEELYNEKNRGYVIHTEHNQFICLVNPAPETSLEDLRDIARHALDFLWKQMGISCTAGIGTLCENIREIRLSYNAARRAEEYKIIAGTGQVLCYQDLTLTAGAYEFVSAAIRVLLAQCVKDADASPEAIFDEIYTRCFGDRGVTTPELARSFIIDLCTQANELLVEFNDQSDAIPAEHLFDLNIETYKSLDGFREYFVRRMTDIRREYSQRHPVKGLGVRIREFIEENYADINLGVNEIGAHFQLFPPYCSRIFRQETNQSIPEVICAVRISHACRRLTESRDSMEKIAEDCGFNSSTVFIRNFKKLCGTTPGSYRKLMQDAKKK